MPIEDELNYMDAHPLVTPSFSDDVFIADNAVVLGDVEIGSKSSVWYGAVIRAELAPVRIGKKTSIQDNCIVHIDYDFPTTVGDMVTVGHCAVLHGCTVEDGAMVGMGANVLNGAKIGAGALVAAGALVREGQEIPAGKLAVGVPAKVVGDVDSVLSEYIERDAELYVELARRYIQAGMSNSKYLAR